MNRRNGWSNGRCQALRDPWAIPTVGAIPGRNRDGGGDLEMRGLTPGELEMTLESLQSEVDRIGQNVDRVSQRLSVPPIPKEQ